MLSSAKNNRWPGRRQNLGLGCLLLVATLRCGAQNLVPNPSFELTDTCPYTIGFQEGDRPLHWYSWFNSPDYFNACANDLQSVDTLVGVPLNGWSYQYAWEGNAYIGLYAFDGYPDEYREYAGVELIEPLEVGCTYQLRFRINPAYGGSYWLIDGGGACDNIGMLFTTASNAWYTTTGPLFPCRNYAHLRTTVPVTDTLNWTMVEGTMVADSAYSHLVLGNFYPDSLTNGFAIGNSWTDITYYLVDGVEVVPLDAGCHGLGAIEVDAPKPWMHLVHGTIQVHWPVGHFEVKVMDLAGKVVAWTKADAGNEARIEVSERAGLLIIQLQSGRVLHTSKFVVP